MLVYNIAFFIIILSAIIISCIRQKVFWGNDNSISVNGRINADLLCRLFFCIAIFGYLIFLAAERFNVGFDFFQYAIAFEDMSEYDSLSAAIKGNSKYEIGYVIFEYVIYQLAPSYKAFFFFHALTVTGLFAWGVFLYSKAPYISAALYILLNLFAFNLNFSRQAISIAVLFVGWGYLYRKKFIRYILLVILACFFHISSLFALSFIILSLIKNKKLLYPVAFVLFCIILPFSDKLLEVGLGLLSGKYEMYADSFYFTQQGKTVFTVVYVAVSVAILLVYFFTDWKKSCESADAAAVVAFVCLITSIIMKKYYIADRFNYFSVIYLIIIIPDALYYLYGLLKSTLDNCFHNKKLAEYLLKTDFKGGEIYKPESPESAELIVKQASKGNLIFSISVVSAFCIVILFSSVANYVFSVDEGSHNAYPYITLNKQLAKLQDKGYDGTERLLASDMVFEYYPLLANEDYIVTVSYAIGADMGDQYNRIILSSFDEYLEQFGVADMFYSFDDPKHHNGGFILDGGRLVGKTDGNGGVTYKYEDNSFSSVAVRMSHYVNINGNVITGAYDSFSVVVYSKSEDRVIDYSVIAKGTRHYSSIIVHKPSEPLNENFQDIYSALSGVKELFVSMSDMRNTVIMFNNNEDYVDGLPAAEYDYYLAAVGSSLTVEKICLENYAGIRFGNEWREMNFANRPAEVTANVYGNEYVVHSDSYNSFVTVNGKEFTAAGTGLNIIVISPDNEVLFNGIINFYEDSSIDRYDRYYEIPQ